MRAKRTDANLQSIVATARKAGFLVHVRNDELADLDVQLHGKHEVWELKDGAKAKSRRKLTALQLLMRDQGWVIRLIESPADVLLARKEMM